MVVPPGFGRHGFRSRSAATGRPRQREQRVRSYATSVPLNHHVEEPGSAGGGRGPRHQREESLSLQGSEDLILQATRGHSKAFWGRETCVALCWGNDPVAGWGMGD